MNDFVGSFGIQGEVEVPDGVDFDTFCNKFMEAIKILGWRFSGFFEDAPGLDVVEVVRCKDCEFRGNDEDAVCPMRHFCGHLQDYTRDNGFCDRGRKEK